MARALLQHDLHVEILRSKAVERAVRLQLFQRLVDGALELRVVLADTKANARAQQLLIRDGRTREFESRALRLLQETLRRRFPIEKRRVQTARHEVGVDLV